jgi:Xaa-Pro aminopeptidase
MSNPTTMPARKRPSPAPSILFHADAGDPDMLYFSRFNAFDPYLAFTAGKKKIGVIANMEYGRMVRESVFDEVLVAGEVAEAAAKRFKNPKGTPATTCQIVRHLAKVYAIREFVVSPRFPTSLAFQLREAGVKIAVAPGDKLFPERAIKTADEVAALRKGNQASAAGFRAVTKALTESKIRRGQLVHQGKVLTAERLRDLIAHACLSAGAAALHTIAAPGDQAVDCHNAGHGPIRAGELIVVDIFPRRMEDGYWGDMTRTFLKGTASDAQRRMVRTVKKAHELGIRTIKPGVTGGKAQQVVEDFMAREGYKTVKTGENPEGFFHSVGHGLGLEVHEDPFIRAGTKWKFRKGMVVTVEPGLYYRGIGGVRIEDVVHLVAGGNEKISSAPYKWEIA